MFCVILSICHYELVFFPNCLKLVRVTPIPKGGDSTKAGNYRPISVLPIFCKIFEKVVYKQLYTIGTSVLGKHSCMSSPFPIAVLNGTCSLRAVILFCGNVPAIKFIDTEFITDVFFCDMLYLCVMCYQQ